MWLALPVRRCCNLELVLKLLPFVDVATVAAVNAAAVAAADAAAAAAAIATASNAVQNRAIKLKFPEATRAARRRTSFLSS